jgi:hypothetical protein
VAFHGGTMAQWRQWWRRKRCISWGGALLLKAARGGGRGRQKRWAGRRVGAAGEIVGGQGGGHGPNAIGTAAPLFRPCG